VSKLADTLFYRRVGVAGTIGRVGMLMIGAVLSYFVGTGLAELMLKAPVPSVLMFTAALIALAGGGADRR